MLPTLYIARHGETTWSLSGQYTGLTVLPLTDHGQNNARHSPVHYNERAAHVSWLGSALDRDLVEWNYGEYEGLRTQEIRAKCPGWKLFRDGCPGGESVAEVGARADRVVDRVRALQEDVLIFSSGHFLRVLAARWLGFEPQAGEHFILSTARLSALSYEDGSVATLKTVEGRRPSSNWAARLQAASSNSWSMN